MARSPKALVDPNVLKWLRDASGYSIDEAAKRIPTRPENLIAWEEGVERPSMPQLRTLARVFKRPISDFFLRRPLPEPDIPHDFRRLPEVGTRRYSPALRHEIRQAYRRRDLALDLVDDLEIELPRFVGRSSITLASNPEEVGATIRQQLRVDGVEQAQWRDADGRSGYNGWRQRIEAAGVFVFQVTTVEKEQMLGFSLAFDRQPVIAVNRKQGPRARTFTMLHEFTHLLLGQSGICDIEESLLRPPQEQRVEVFCNHVAGAALVPMQSLLASRFVGNDSLPREWAEDTLDALTRQFGGASKEVVLRRLLIAGRTTVSFYARKRAEWHARAVANEVRAKERQKEAEMKRNVPQEAISNLGAFARIVISSYNSDAINITDASKFLGVKAEKVSAVGDLLR
jgi:Zn-dependent peptidase ImmA (M78 family)/DNA-binding XRE family transcriptional regulator